MARHLETEGNEMEVEEDWVDGDTRPGIPGRNPSSSPEAIPFRASPALSAQAPASPSSSVQLPAPASSFDRNCVQPRSPVGGRPPCDEPRWNQFHEGCSQKGYRRKGKQDVLKTRFALDGRCGGEAHIGRKRISTHLGNYYWERRAGTR